MVEIRRLKPLTRLAIPTKPFVPPKNPKPQRRLKDYPSPTPQPTPCRLWQGAVDKYGYGKKKVKYAEHTGWESDKIHRWVLNQIREVRLRWWTCADDGHHLVRLQSPRVLAITNCSQWISIDNSGGATCEIPN